MTQTVGERLRDHVAAAKGWSLAQLASELGVSYETVRKWVTGDNAPNRNRTNQIAELLGKTPEWVLFGTVEDASPEVEPAGQLKPRLHVPVVGEVKGGENGFLDELQYPVGHGEGFVEFPTSDPNAYAVRVRGESMHPRYRAGEFVVIEPSIEPQEGDDVIVTCVNGRKMLKELSRMRDGEVELRSVNNGFAPITLQADEVDSIQLVAGRVRRGAMKRG